MVTEPGMPILHTTLSIKNFKDRLSNRQSYDPFFPSSRLSIS